jgi:predicted amidophosphoribosyltransferase
MSDSYSDWKDHQCPNCGKQMEHRWHLACDKCWAKLPKQLRTDVYDAYKNAHMSARHTELIAECYAYLKKA